LWPIASWAQRYATYLQREIRTVPVRSEDCGTRLGDRGLLRAHAGVNAQAAGVVGGARHPVPIVGRWRFAVAGRDRPATQARACVESSLRCWSDRRLRVRAPAQAVRRRSGGQAFGGRATSVGVKPRRGAGAWCSTCWGDRRRRRVAPTSSGFDYPGDKAKAGTRVRVAESGGGVRTLRPVTTVSCALCSACSVAVVVAGWRLPRRGLTTPETRRKPEHGSGFVGTGPIHVFVLAHRLRPNGIA